MEIANWYSVAKAMHLIGMVSWMAGLFYLVRLMVYHAETAEKRSAAEQSVLFPQFMLMENRVYRIILQPAVVITWAFGTLMLALQPVWFQQAWIYAKLGFVLLLTAYTYYCNLFIGRLQAGTSTFRHVHFRILNEVPTIILAAAVFLAVFKDRINWWYFCAGIGIFSALILTAIRRVARKS